MWNIFKAGSEKTGFTENAIFPRGGGAFRGVISIIYQISPAVKCARAVLTKFFACVIIKRSVTQFFTAPAADYPKGGDHGAR